jgi:hypothetical protein
LSLFSKELSERRLYWNPISESVFFRTSGWISDLTAAFFPLTTQLRHDQTQGARLLSNSLAPTYTKNRTAVQAITKLKRLVIKTGADKINIIFL